MNSYRIWALAALPTVAALSLAASSDQQKIKEVYGKLSRAMITKNLSAIEALEGPGFTDTEGGRTMNKDDANKTMKQAFAMGRITYCHINVLSIKITGKTATAITGFTINGTGKINGKNHKLHATGKTADTLLKTDKGWLFTATKDTEEHQTMDGKKVGT